METRKTVKRVAAAALAVAMFSGVVPAQIGSVKLLPDMAIAASAEAQTSEIAVGNVYRVGDTMTCPSDSGGVYIKVANGFYNDSDAGKVIVDPDNPITLEAVVGEYYSERWSGRFVYCGSIKFTQGERIAYNTFSGNPIYTDRFLFPSYPVPAIKVVGGSGTSNDPYQLCNYAHSHNWVYSLSEDEKSIIATCDSGDNCEPHTGTSSFSMTLNSPKIEAYGDGKSTEATITKDDGFPGDTPTITYWESTDDGATWAAWVPSNDKTEPYEAGKYQARITLGGVTAVCPYNIGKSKPDIEEPSYSTTMTYNGFDQPLLTQNFNYNLAEFGEWRYQLWNAENNTWGTVTTNPPVGKDAGTYKVMYYFYTTKRNWRSWIIVGDNSEAKTVTITMNPKEIENPRNEITDPDTPQLVMKTPCVYNGKPYNHVYTGEEDDNVPNLAAEDEEVQGPQFELHHITGEGATDYRVVEYGKDKKEYTYTISGDYTNATYKDQPEADKPTIEFTDVTGGNYNIHGKTTFEIEQADSPYDGTVIEVDITPNVTEEGKIDIRDYLVDLTDVNHVEYNTEKSTIHGSIEGFNVKGLDDDGFLLYSLKEVEYNENAAVYDSGVINAVISSRNYKDYLIRINVNAKPGITSTEFVLDGTEDMVYTGKAIKQPDLKVYSAGLLLEEGKDYTLSYSNNTKVGTASVTVKGKGNYSTKQVTTFEILPADIGGEDFSADDIYLKSTGKNQKKTPVLKWNGSNVASSNYTVKYYEEGTTADDDPPEEITDFSKSYVIMIEGKGNFKGKRAVNVIIDDSKETILASSATVKLDQTTFILGDEPVEPTVTVSKGDTVYEEGTDYELVYSDNEAIGKGTVTVVGSEGGGIIGTKSVTFTIKGTSISSAEISDVPATVAFDPTAVDGITLEEGSYTLKLGDTKLLEGTDYTVSYEKNNKVGTAKVVFTGCGKYFGSKKQSFSITPIKITDVNVVCDEETSYAKSGAKPKITLTYDSEITGETYTLIEGTDYTVTYTNNKDITDGSDAIATIKGKGNFTETATCEFQVVANEVEDGDDALTMTIADLTYNGTSKTKLSSFIKAPDVRDADGKKLTKGTDYEDVIKYEIVDPDGEDIDITAYVKDSTKFISDYIDLVTEDYANEGIAIKATITLKGNYSGTYSTVYRIATKKISSASIKTSKKYYTGSEVNLDPYADIVITIGTGKNKVNLVYGTDYEIIGYTNNINKGTATVTIRGIGKYCGTKTANFKIVAKEM